VVVGGAVSARAAVVGACAPVVVPLWPWLLLGADGDALEIDVVSVPPEPHPQSASKPPASAIVPIVFGLTSSPESLYSCCAVLILAAAGALRASCVRGGDGCTLPEARWVRARAATIARGGPSINSDC
jgi:hypothetical protein